jgi:ubiquinone/menaquinone biosynthesis C-methylase UbiE
LDVGCGTGKPLQNIISQFPDKVKVTGIDIDKNYIEACNELFNNNKQVQIIEKSFYDIKELTKNTLYDIIFFSFSFMLMPEKE